MVRMREWFERVRGGLALLMAVAAGASFAAEGAGPEATELRAEALKARRAIAEVYHRHRLWPESNRSAQPASREQVDDAALLAEWDRSETLRAVLARRWQIEVTPAMLQRELDRIARDTRDASRLRELFGALRNDPRQVATYLIQPLLVERLAQHSFARDPEIHAHTRTGIDASFLRASSLGEFRVLVGDEGRLDFVRSGAAMADEQHALSPAEWETTLTSLRRELGVATLEAGQLGPLVEHEREFVRIGIESLDEDSMTLIRKAWPKQSLAAWLAEGGPSGGEAAPLPPVATSSGALALPEPEDREDLSISCEDDTWRGPLQQEPPARFAHTAVWTGSEMIVYGGLTFSDFVFAGGGRYDPATDTWSPLSEVGAPMARGQHTAVWSGTEMLVWGGTGDEVGGRYDPSTDSWTLMSTVGAPWMRENHVAVWTGTEMIVWGGYEQEGGRYDPVFDQWTLMSEIDAPTALPFATAVWTGTEMIVWGGGEDPFEPSDEGARYDPVHDVWITLPFFPQEPRIYHSAVWTGDEMIIWGGQGLEFDPDTGSEMEVPLTTGAKYSPATDSWESIFGPNPRYRHTAVWSGSEMLIYGGEESPDPAESFDPQTDLFTVLPPNGLVEGRTEHTAVWTGTEMIVWGGIEESDLFKPVSSGVIYREATHSWFPTRHQAPEPRAGHTAVWTGAEMIVFGGRGPTGDFDEGRRYDPALDDWRRFSAVNRPSFREHHRAVWTGTEMIVWGGRLGGWEQSGGRYDPAADSWTDTTLVGAPAPRGHHAMAWSGSEMLVWGGTDGSMLGDGARYDPVTDSWSPISSVNAPSARRLASFVWTGSEAFLWGGSESGGFAGDGRLYDPAADVWSTVASSGAPSARTEHTAVWTGSEVLVWGGHGGSGDTDTGAHYAPDTDTWSVLPTTGAPSARRQHTAVWDGESMIVWGGQLGGNVLGSGGRYDPTTQTWTETSENAAPTGRYDHRAVWTGSEMLIWGGRVDNSEFNPDHGAYCSATACSPVDWYRDADDDGVGDAGDTLSECEQPPGYVASAGDCNDADGTVYGTPGEVRALEMSHDGVSGSTTVTWQAPLEEGGAAGSLSYDLLRSPEADDFQAAASCLESGTAATTSEELGSPPPGAVWFYLVRARNACPTGGVGSLGHGSSGTEREGAACP